MIRLKYANRYFLFFILLGMGIFVYRDFLVFRKLFIYADIGCDTKNEKIQKVNIGFTGIFLTKGFHTVELRYSKPYVMPGFAISLSGWMFYLGFLLKQYFRRRRSLEL